MYIVTSGSSFLDVDAYGGCVAYAELLQKCGEESKAISTAPLNESITPRIRSWNAPLATMHEANPEDNFILIDVSEPDFFDSIVDLQRVTKVIDHHPGFEEYWQKLGQDSVIEFIGAACTLVYEQWLKAGKFDEMSPLSARLLASGILDNTLNFEAGVTTDRDREAYDKLIAKAGPEFDGWAAEYFMDCQNAIEADVRLAVVNDAKTMNDTAHLPRAFGQLVVWNASQLLKKHRGEISRTLAGMDNDWALNLVSIEEGKSYFVAENPITQQKLGALLDLNLSSGVAEANRLYLRKEILKLAQETTTN